MGFEILYYTFVLLFAGLTYASVEGRIPMIPRLQYLVVFGLSLISEWPLPVIVLKIVLIFIASMLGVFSKLAKILYSLYNFGFFFKFMDLNLTFFFISLFNSNINRRNYSTAFLHS